MGLIEFLFLLAFLLLAGLIAYPLFFLPFRNYWNKRKNETERFNRIRELNKEITELLNLSNNFNLEQIRDELIKFITEKNKEIKSFLKVLDAEVTRLVQKEENEYGLNYQKYVQKVNDLAKENGYNADFSIVEFRKEINRNQDLKSKIWKDYLNLINSYQNDFKVIKSNFNKLIMILFFICNPYFCL